MGLSVEQARQLCAQIGLEAVVAPAAMGWPGVFITSPKQLPGWTAWCRTVDNVLGIVGEVEGCTLPYPLGVHRADGSPCQIMRDYVSELPFWLAGPGMPLPEFADWYSVMVAVRAPQVLMFLPGSPFTLNRTKAEAQRLADAAVVR